MYRVVRVFGGLCWLKLLLCVGIGGAVVGAAACAPHAVAHLRASPWDVTWTHASTVDLCLQTDLSVKLVVL